MEPEPNDMASLTSAMEDRAAEAEAFLRSLASRHRLFCADPRPERSNLE